MSGERLAAGLQDLRELTAFRLANEADCGCPDSVGSAGATFLMSVRDSLAEAVEYDHAEDETVADTLDRLRHNGGFHEIADNAPDVYTATRWAEFVDLQAYYEDPTELGFDGADMQQGAGVCLYIIAERLVEALARLLIESWEYDEAADEAEAGELVP